MAYMPFKVSIVHCSVVSNKTATNSNSICIIILRVIVCYRRRYFLEELINLVYFNFKRMSSKYLGVNTWMGRFASHSDRLNLMTNVTLISYSVQDKVISLFCGIISVCLPSNLVFDLVHLHIWIDTNFELYKDS